MDELEDSDGMYGINIAPLVDVALVLVLIFMVTSPFMVKGLLPVKLPQAVASQAENKENITISISPDEGFAINEVPVGRGELMTKLKSVAKDSGFSFLLIRSDERVPYGEVEYVMKVGRQVGMKRIAFATEPKSRPQ
jgi:biopolymer transport protein TolR